MPSRLFRVLVCSATFASVCVVPQTTFAQGVGGATGVANATAIVQQPLEVTKTNDLDFGTVVAGENKAVGVTSSNAASFVMHGSPNSQVHLTLTLPLSLANGTNLLLTSGWVGRYNETGLQGNGIDFAPSSAPSTITFGTSGALYMYLGAMVKPTADQVPGTYTGTITLTVEYF